MSMGVRHYSRATQGKQDPKADYVDLQPLTSDGAGPGCFMGTSDGAVGGWRTDSILVHGVRLDNDSAEDPFFFFFLGEGGGAGTRTGYVLTREVCVGMPRDPPMIIILFMCYEVYTYIKDTGIINSKYKLLNKKINRCCIQTYI